MTTGLASPDARGALPGAPRHGRELASALKCARHATRHGYRDAPAHGGGFFTGTQPTTSRDYAGASLKRRVLHALRQFDCETISQLQSKVLHDAQVFQQLLEILTIPFTEMFRDPSYWLALRSQVTPLLRTYPSLKVWVAGCSTGEEVFSLAILLQEEGLLERTHDLRHRRSILSVLEKSRQGIFPIGAVRQHTANYQASGGKRAFSDYYTAAYNSARASTPTWFAT